MTDGERTSMASPKDKRSDVRRGELTASDRESSEYALAESETEPQTRT